MHKLLLAAALMLPVSTASAQGLDFPRPLPKTVTINGPDGQKIGTATVTGNRAFIRDAKNELLGTAVVTREGTTFYDPDGKVVPREQLDETLLRGLGNKPDADTDK